MFEILTYCYCSMPENFDKKMVACDRCEKWFHVKCVCVEYLPDIFVCNSFVISMIPKQNTVSPSVNDFTLIKLLLEERHCIIY